jgi:oxygen-dependent protoporphyrinogen oxidase
MTSPQRIAIIGGGIVGLTAAHTLAARGASVTVFEAGKEVGGAIATLRDGDWLVEGGPNTLLLRDTSCDALFTEIGLDPSLILANPEAERRFIVRYGKPQALPSSLWGAITTPIFRFGGKVRVLMEPLIPQNRHNPDEMLDSFARRRVGQEFLDYAVNPFIGGVYSCSPEELCVRHALPRLWRLEQNHGSLVAGTIALMRAKKKSGVKTKSRLVSFKEGLVELPRALARSLGNSVRTGAHVHAITRNGAWKLLGEQNGESFEETFDAVLICTTASAAADLEIAGTQPLAGLAAMPYTNVTSVALGFNRADVAHALDGFGMLVPAKEGHKILGTLFSSTLFPGRAPEGKVLLTTFVGGRQPEVASLPDDELLATILGELATILGVRAVPIFKRITRWPRAIPKYGADFPRYVGLMEQFESAHPGIQIAGHMRNGISLPDCINAGRAAAERVIGA